MVKIISVYYAEKVFAPSVTDQEQELKEAVANSAYTFVWAGGAKKLDLTEPAEDLPLLEAVFSYFNRQAPPDFIGSFRSLSIGDVVCLDERAFLCKTLGWMQLENFAYHSI